jgi:hypothetical protein
VVGLTSRLNGRETLVDISELRVDDVDLGEDVLGEVGEELLDFIGVSHCSGVGICLVFGYQL